MKLKTWKMRSEEVRENVIVIVVERKISVRIKGRLRIRSPKGQIKKIEQPYLAHLIDEGIDEDGSCTYPV